jgi:hypothetical protein
MSLIPTYYCDNCGHAFTTPKSGGWYIVQDRDECEDGVCPKCSNPDFELLKPEEDDE